MVYKDFMNFIQSGSEKRIFRISSDNKLDDAQNFLLNFLIYVQIASTGIYMITQNCIQNTASLQKHT